MAPRRKSRRLMPAERLARIAYELVAIQPDAPIFLTRLLDRPVDSPLGLDPSATATPKGQPS